MNKICINNTEKETKGFNYGPQKTAKKSEEKNSEIVTVVGKPGFLTRLALPQNLAGQPGQTWSCRVIRVERLEKVRKRVGGMQREQEVKEGKLGRKARERMEKEEERKTEIEAATATAVAVASEHHHPQRRK